MKFREENNIRVLVDQYDLALLQKDDESFRIPDAILNFSECDFHVKVMAAISKAGFEKPSPIQSQCWPIVMNEHDLIGIAKTGSGNGDFFSLIFIF